MGGNRGEEGGVPIRDCGFFALRTPLLPFDDLLEWAAEGGDGRAWLQATVSRPEVREAIFLSSPDLDGAIDSWTADPEGSRSTGVARAVARYVQRMAARPTPFGLFAGGSVGVVGAGTRLELGPRATYRRRSRLDTYFLTALAEATAAMRSPDLRYLPNETLHHFGGRVRLIASRWEGEQRTHQLITVRDSPPLRAAEAAAAGGAAFDILTRAVAQLGVDGDAAAAFVEGLISRQVLVAQVAPLVTGVEPLQSVVATIAMVDPAAGESLVQVNEELAAMDRQGLGVEPAAYRAVADELHALPAPVEPSRLFQVDMIKPAPGASLGRAVIEEMKRAVTLLHLLSSRRDDPLVSFREDFERRFEDREVPLLAALDPEVGVRFGSSRVATPLLDGLDFPPSQDRPAGVGTT